MTNTAAMTATTSATTISREASRLLALWIAEEARVEYLQPGEEVSYVKAGDSVFGSGHYSARSRVIGPIISVEPDGEDADQFVSDIKGRVVGAHGAVLTTTVNGRGVRRVAWLDGLPTEGAIPGGPPGPDWVRYWERREQREEALVSIPEVREAFRRAAAGREVARTLDARLAKADDADDALYNAPPAVRILFRLRHSAGNRAEANTAFGRLARELLG